ncbi:S-layer homology domain-containing protein [Planomicrobium sp. YIM 101495]|uniref:S-layer homology domain-containing protein n=1 Tax=Planomicrobium sp. YIM 101495 TaxID=2665160 RepID=UPI0012B821EC|nr:S-layer homology domain-containing protein [Planomicrobium sp. YIM 101495]MTD30644.1 S-layer homology domain-containing protein [Planomicrobium sp. YIM 101495]
MKTLGSLLAAAVLTFGLFSSPATAIVLFDDVNADHSFAFEIAYLHEEGIINSYTDGTFRPNAPVTRAHAAAMIVRALDLDDSPRQTGFRDVPASHTFSGPIAAAVDEEIVFGFANNYFGPGLAVTRAQVAAMLDRAFYFPEASDNGFTDMHANHFAFDSVSRLADAGVALGYPDNRFRPDAPVTRAQFSAFLARTIEPSFIPEKKELLTMANEILADLKVENFVDVATYVGTENGLTFCPYSGGCFEDGGVTFAKAELPAFMTDETERLWGYEDGSGFAIKETPAEYYDDYLLDANYTSKTRFDRTEQPMTQDWIHMLYPEATIVEFYFPGTAQYEGMDWQSLNMVFEKTASGDWILVAIINDRWTI